LSEVTIPLSTSVCVTSGTPPDTGSGDKVAITFETNSGDPALWLVGARVDFLP
jgi:hypothetical protein